MCRAYGAVYWEPQLDEKAHMVHQMYKDDGISFEEVTLLLRRFGNQPLDFFGAIRSNTYDYQILCAFVTFAWHQC